MKKIFSFILTILLLSALALPAYAENEAASMPRVMVTDYKVNGVLKAGERGKITVILTNRSKTNNVGNLKLTFSDSSGDIVPVGVTSGYVEKLGAKKSVTWVIEVKISENATNGNHAVSVMCEYDSGSSSDIINLNVIGKNETSAAQNTSQPRLMVTDYSVENDYLTPGESKNLKITVKNTSPSKAVSNIKLALSDESGEIKTDGMGTAYVKSIAANSSYIWDVDLTAVHTAKTGEHPLTLSIEYEDSSHTSYSSSDIIRVNIRQTVRLSYDSARLPVKVIQGETVTVGINLMNTGKSTLHNCMIDIDVDKLESGGTVLVGEIPQGESKQGNVNLRVSTDYLGKVEGTIKITYEDDFGEEYSETVDASTVIEKKVIKAEEEKKEKKNPLWWMFMLIGAVIGGGLGFCIPYAIRSSKQRKEDEKRL